VGERVHAAAADYEEARAPPIEPPTAEPADDG
jgi:thioredoxin reductase (NADPH)